MTKPARGWTPAELRQMAAERSGRRCEWPNGAGGTCNQPMAELAHIRARGMGGGSTRNVPSNVFAACEAHARISDLLPPPGKGTRQMYDEIRLVPGCQTAKPGDNLKPALVAGLSAWVATLAPFTDD